MNLYGSYRKLLANSKHAVIAAIEIYNKPKFEYREEIFTILIATAWELFILAVLSKNKQRVFAPKKRHEEYRTLSFEEAIRQAKKYFPKEKSPDAVISNIRSLRAYRNTVVHYYQKEQNKHAVYMLAHASIMNYRDLLLSIFNHDIASEVSIVLLPLSFNRQPNFVEFFKKTQKRNFTPFVNDLFTSMQALESINGVDTNRFITECVIRIEPANSIKTADVIVNVKGGDAEHVVLRDIDPDDKYPFFRKNIIGDKNTQVHKNLKRGINSYLFQIIVWKYSIKKDRKYCWASKKGGSPRYSQNMINFLNNLTDNEIERAKEEYRNFRQRENLKKV